MARARVLVVLNGRGWGLGWLAHWLPDRDLDIEVIHADEGTPLPRRLTRHDALVLMPGATSVASGIERPSWLEREIALAAHTLATARPMLGICLGGQILTVAGDGAVAAGHDPEYGLVDLELTAQQATDPIFGGLETPVRAAAWHYEGTVEAPPGSIPLARSQLYPHSAYRLGDHAWSIQFHPEATPAAVRGWARVTSAELAARGRRWTDVAEDARRGAKDLMNHWCTVVHRFGDVVNGICAPPGPQV